MTGGRVTIGTKPIEDEATPAVPSDPTQAASDADVAVDALESLNAMAAATAESPESSDPAVNAWLRQGVNSPPSGAPDLPSSPSDLPTEVAPAAKPAEPPTSTSALPWNRMPPLSTLLLSAAVGAVVAAVTVIIFSLRFAPSLDVRFSPVTERIAAIEEQIQQGDAAIGRLNSEIAQAIDLNAAISERVVAQTAELYEFLQIADQNIQKAAEADPTLFAVAVIQLRTTFYTGRPFEVELVSVHKLARADRRVLGLLDKLSAPARSGVATFAALRENFVAFAAAAGLTVGEPQTYYDYGLTLLDQYVVKAASTAATEVNRKLVSGDVVGAIDSFAGMDATIAATFRPWLENARLYVRVESAVVELTEAAVDSLRPTMPSHNVGE